MLILRGFIVLFCFLFWLFLESAPLSAQGALEGPAAKLDWIKFLDKNPRALPKEFQVGGPSDLLTTTGQLQFIERKQQSPSASDRGIADMMKAWQVGPTKSPAPVGAIRLVLDPKLSVPITPKSQVLQPVLYRQNFLLEVDPERGANTIRDRYPELRPQPGQPPLPPLADLDNPFEIARQKACGGAVKKLRAKVRLPGVDADFDRIRGFYKVCLFASGNTTSPPPLTEFERRAATECAQAYDEFANHCYDPEKVGQWRQTLSPHIGIIVAKAANSNRKSIVCSGVEVAQGVILTARHCFAEFPEVSGPAVVAWFRPVGNNPSGGEEYAITDALVAPEFKAAKLHDAIAAFKKAAEANELNLNHDIMLLKIAKGLAGPPAKVKVRTATAFESVALVGFQRLIFNAMLLNKRLRGQPLFNDEDLLATGAWRTAFMFDASPTCMLLPFMAGDYTKYGLTKEAVLGHFCQSLGSTSGGGMIVLPRNAEPTASVVAVHTGHLTDEALFAQGVPVESVRPSNISVVVNAGLRKALGE